MIAEGKRVRTEHSYDDALWRLRDFSDGKPDKNHNANLDICVAAEEYFQSAQPDFFTIMPGKGRARKLLPAKS